MNTSTRIGFTAPPARQNGTSSEHAKEQPAKSQTLPDEYIGRAMLVVAALVHERIIPYIVEDSLTVDNHGFAIEIVSEYLRHFDDIAVTLDQKLGDHAPGPLIEWGD